MPVLPAEGGVFYMNVSLIRVMATAAGLFPGILFSADNLLKNGNVEEVKDGQPLCWFKGCTGGSAASVVKDGENHRLHLKKVNDGKSTFAAWIQDVTVRPGTEYRLSGIAEGEGRLFWYELDENRKFLKQIRGVTFKNSAKSPVSTVFRTSPKTGICQIRFEIYGRERAAEGFLDDVCFEELQGDSDGKSKGM